MYPSDNRFNDTYGHTSHNPSDNYGSSMQQYGNQSHQHLRMHSMDVNNSRSSYYDPPYTNQNTYDYPAQIPSSYYNEAPDSRYNTWRDQSRGPVMPPYYDRGNIMGDHSRSQMTPGYPPYDSYEPVRSPQVNVLQRISFLIKSQLPDLKKTMSRVNQGKKESKNHRDRSKSRQRSRQREKSKKSSEWVCAQCSFLNFDFRDRCKKCNDKKPFKNFVPSPQDWRCSKCNNLNYARRLECNRCKLPRNR